MKVSLAAPFLFACTLVACAGGGTDEGPPTTPSERHTGIEANGEFTGPGDTDDLDRREPDA